VAGLGAGVLVWGTTAQKRLLLAERDVTGLNRPDPDAGELLDRFGAEVAASPPPRDRGDLLKLYARSVLAEADYPVSLALWFGDERPPEHIATSVFASDTAAILTTVAAAQQLHTGAIAEAVGSPGVQLVLAVPITAAPGDALSAVVAPQTRLIRESPVAPFLGLPADTGTAPLYTISLLAVRQAGAMSADTALPRMQWHRHGSALHGDWLVRGADGPVRAHVEIQLRPLRALVQRGVLLLVLDLLVVGPLWALSVLGDGAFWRWLRVRLRRWRRSYRTQLTVVLFAFFVAPAAVFVIWSERRLRTDDTDARALRVSETLRSVIAEGNLGRLDIAGGRLDTPLLLYDDGELVASSDTLYAELAPLGRLLRPDIELGLGLGGEVEASRTAYLAGVRMLIGYRVVTGENGEHLILAAPARLDAADIERPNEDLRVLVLFTTVLGAAAALWLSGLAARQLARPIDQLRRAALAVARGEREPALAGDPPVEFTPVFSAFRRMAADFGESQRVLAWGEMARQVAHEIKNPLTPIRLGIQHLLRARSDPRVDFDHVLRQNAERILTEIDRLDEIARSFSRYGTAPAERPPAERTDVAAVARDVLALERLGSGGGIAWELVGADADVAPAWARARADELREVLLNVLENARHAQSRHVRLHVAAEGARVTIVVEDDGDGIPPDILPHIFEPHFSTRTSGSGLGLAVSRRVIDGWGGSIAVASRRTERGGGGRGTRVTIALRAS
jgi:signal transduction histidine kinase